MSGGIVTSSDFAHAEAAKMKNIIGNDLPAMIRQLNSHGEAMSDRQHWAGPLADQFRTEVWPKAKADLDKMQTALIELNRQVSQILTRITQAGS